MAARAMWYVDGVPVGVAAGGGGGGGGSGTVVTDGATILGIGTAGDKVRAKTDAGGLALRTYAESTASAAQSAAQSYADSAAASAGSAAVSSANSYTNGLNATALHAANNLSDVGNAATARASLGLGTAATQASGAFDAAGAAAAAAAASVPTGRTIQGTSPIAIAGDYAAHDLSANRVVTFAVASEARGDLVARGASTWGRLAVGTAGRVLSSDGTDPAWATFTSVYIFGSDARGDIGVRGASAYGRLAIGAAGRILGSDGTDPSWVTFASLYAFGSDAQGDLAYRNATTYTRLAAGTAGQALITGGAGANPSWDYPTTIGKSAADTTYDGGVRLGANASETVSTSTTLSATKTWHDIDNSGAVHTVTLPDAAATNSLHTLDDSTGSFATNPCTVQAENSHTINGSSTPLVLSVAWGTWHFRKLTSTTWQLLGGAP